MQTKQILTESVLSRLFDRMGGASFAVVDKTGAQTTYGSGAAQFTIRFKDDSILDLLHGDLLMSFGEAYMDGRVEIEGDLADLVSLALQNNLMSVTQPSQGFTGKTLLWTDNKFFALKREQENIAHHYDLGNDFFRLWLDQSLTYSCAYFRGESDTLDLAQQQKVEHSLGKLRLQPGETLLDIGCGWGALVIRAAEHFGAEATGITLSEEQDAGANAAIAAHGLEDAASVRLLNYRTLAATGKRFDKIVSIGMIEHVGKENLAKFVGDVKRMLKPGGLALLHSITGVKEGAVNRWIEKYIFPGGYIPTLPEIVTHLAARDLRIWDVENLAAHYRLTLDDWSKRFEQARPSVLEKFDERFVRMWRLYLRASSAAFREGAVEVHQILVSRGQPKNLPLTREDIYESKT